MRQLQSPQLERLRRFSAVECADIHCHCLPGLDDGPQTLDESIALCKALVEDGVTVVVATPHQLGAYERANSAEVVRAAVASLNATLTQENIPLTVLPGADVRVDDQLLDLLDKDEILTLADAHRYILLELPSHTMVNLLPVIQQLNQRGIVSVISHPERQSQICRNLELLVPWIQHGALLQITAGSLLGAFGPIAEKKAWEMLSLGVVSMVASDAHSAEHRPPMMTQAIAAISKRINHAVARKLCIENPVNLVQASPARARPGPVGSRA